MARRRRKTKTGTDSDGELLELDDIWTRPDHQVAEHVHPGMEESWEVLAGAVRFQIAGVERSARVGETLVAPPGTPHMAWNAGGAPAHLRIRMPPALRWEVVETLFRLAAEGRTDERGVPEPAALRELMREFSRELAPPTATRR